MDTEDNNVAIATTPRIDYKLNFLGWKLIVDGKINRKAIIGYIRSLMEGKPTNFSIVDGEYLRREANYAVESINIYGVNIMLWPSQRFHIGWEQLSDTLLIKTLWNVAYLHRHLTLKQERVIRSAFQDVYQTEDTDIFPVYGVTML